MQVNAMHIPERRCMSILSFRVLCRTVVEKTEVDGVGLIWRLAMLTNRRLNRCNSDFDYAGIREAKSQFGP